MLLNTEYFHSAPRTIMPWQVSGGAIYAAGGAVYPGWLESVIAEQVNQTEYMILQDVVISENFAASTQPSTCRCDWGA